jgi:hypothetical protein
MLGRALTTDHSRDVIRRLRALFEHRDHQLGETRMTEPWMCLLRLSHELPKTVVEVDGDPKVHEAGCCVIGCWTPCRSSLAAVESRTPRRLACTRPQFSRRPALGGERASRIYADARALTGARFLRNLEVRFRPVADAWDRPPAR